MFSIMAKKVTMQHIADCCGVSKFVVSKALSGKGGVSEATKQKVLLAASQLGYFTQQKAPAKSARADAAAAAPSGAKRSVLVLMPNIRFQTKDSAYWGKILNGISETLEQKGIGMIIVSEQSIDQLQHVLNLSGIMGFIGVGEISSSLLLEVHRLGMPMVLVDHEDPLIPADTVFVNNCDSMMRLTKHLIALGHGRICFVGDIRFSRSFYDRWLGVRAALEERETALPAPHAALEERKAGLPAPSDGILHLEGLSGFKPQILSWLSERQAGARLPSAFVCGNDAIAIEMLQALDEQGIRVPDEVSVTGFDNVDDAVRTMPQLTTVHVPKETLGRRAVELLMERIHGKRSPAEKLLIGGELMLRDSAGEGSGSMGHGRA